MPVPTKGSVRPQEERDRISEGTRAALRRRPPWTHWFSPIKQTADAGDERLAVRLLREYIKSRKDAA